MPSLIYQLAQASNQKHVDFTSIATGGESAPRASASSATRRRPRRRASAGFTQMPFTFVFNGSFFDL